MPGFHQLERFGYERNFLEAVVVHDDVKGGMRLLYGLGAASILALAIDVGWRLFAPSPPPARIGRPVDFFASHKTVLGMYKVDCGRYPTTEEGLNALIKCPANLPASEWRGPYFDPPQLPKDPWDRGYVYRCPGIHNTDGFDLFSCGPDGVSKTGGDDADDINNWNPSSYTGQIFWTR
jgi:general secretion pathway protein G